MDQLKSMEIFVHVVDRGSFAAAAEPFGMTAPMIGRHVSSLEAALGTALLHRTTRRHALTEAGRIYYDRAKAILADVAAAQESVALMRDTPRGVLRIGAPVGFGSMQLAPVLPRYLDAYPDVRIELVLNNRVFDILEEGYDLVIRTGDLPDSDLMRRSLAPTELVLCASPLYLERVALPQHPRDLQTLCCLGFRPGALQEKWVFQDPDGAQITVPVSGQLAVNDGQSLRQAALGGAGIVLQSERLLGSDLKAGRLVRLLETYKPVPLPVHALYAPTRSVPPKLRSFLDFLAQEFRPRGSTS